MLYVVGSAEENEILLYRWDMSSLRPRGIMANRHQRCTGTERLSQYPAEVGATSFCQALELTTPGTRSTNAPSSRTTTSWYVLRADETNRCNNPPSHSPSTNSSTTASSWKRTPSSWPRASASPQRKT
jgi:hypothetical protein